MKMEFYDLFDQFKTHPQDFISSVGQLLIGLGVFGNMLLSWFNGKKIEQVHKATNSMKDELVKTTQVAGEYKGRADERREANERKQNGTPDV